MPWYWSDDLAPVLVSLEAIDGDTADRLVTSPAAYRRPESNIEDAALGLLDDGEIPLAA